MRWSKWKDVKLAEVATIERAKAGKVYPFGCSLIPLSAWQIESISFLEEPQEVSGRYAVIIPNASKVLPRYLFINLIRLRKPTAFRWWVVDEHSRQCGGI